ncbi:cytochrome P450 [Suillus clintonianus]|uniref:cytochrome P450 n=1 Tax=Suillus clintonianus TaxID=1904413 RepID=UPI001B86D651|nr:cytochrome P450 [Suillus clintonianus]KAG2133748.1 cytochrome P450 [Suillus clintonianus]
MLQLPDLRISDNTQLVLGAAACAGVVGVTVRAYLRKSASGLPLPPSPSTWRLRGHFLPYQNAFLTIAQWIDEYGPLITIRSGTQNVVIIGRHKAAVDIMEKQGGLVADRPRLAAGEILNRGLGIGLSPAGDRFRRKRRALHSHLQPKAAEAYQPLQMSYAKSVVLNILDDPDNFQNHAVTYASATIMKVAYGKTTPTSATDPEIREIRQLFKRFRFILRPGFYLVDSIPLLRYLPGYAPELKDERERTTRLYTDQLNRVKQQMQSDVDIGPSFAKYMLENESVYGLSEIEMAYLAGAFFGAGAATTAIAICTVLMAAARFPEEQAKVQDELDAVIGRERAPTFADKQSLPRLEAFISEALRWRPLAPEGFPHRTTQDVIWENYCIPAGTTVTGNHWAISRDPEVYPEPDAFKPQRWINDQGRLRSDLSFFVFGFGRRVCPGQHLANRSVFINALLILWAFQLSLDPTKPQDDMGFTNASIPNVPCAIEFKTRVPEVELRAMMQDHSEAE